jgi:hypothetical protein
VLQRSVPEVVDVAGRQHVPNGLRASWTRHTSLVLNLQSALQFTKLLQVTKIRVIRDVLSFEPAVMLQDAVREFFTQSTLLGAIGKPMYGLEHTVGRTTVLDAKHGCLTMLTNAPGNAALRLRAAQ